MKIQITKKNKNLCKCYDKQRYRKQTHIYLKYDYCVRGVRKENNLGNLGVSRGKCSKSNASEAS